jgi:4-amino-4-deoxy-L-arabinose transferase-like glycosyltransferase
MLTIGIITSALLFIYAFLLTDNLIISLLSVILLNSIPTYLLTSRYALLENILQPFVLAQLIFLLLVKRYKKYSMIFLILSGILAGLSVLVKETGLGFLFASLVLLFVWKEPKRYKILFTISAGVPILIYILWGLWMSPKIFLEVFISNSSRGFFGPLNFISIFPSLRFARFPLDGWLTWGFISILFLIIKKPKENLDLLLPFFGHLLLLLFLSSANYPWYYFALIPFLVIASSTVIWDMIITPSFGIIFPFAFIPLSTSLYWGNTVFNLPPKILTYRLVIFGFLAIGIAKIIKPKNAILRIFWVVACILIFYEVLKWNRFSMEYIIDHWDKLPALELF